MNNRILAAIAVLALGATSAAHAGKPHHHDHDRHDNRARARVVNVQPIVERVRFTVPVEHCWNERERHVHGGPDRTAATLAGTAVGAVIGNRISDGKGAGTVAGAIAGAVVGSQLANDRGRGVHYRDVRRCEVRHEERFEKRVVAYRVTYEHRGKREVARLAYDPGRYVAIADVRRRS